MSGRIFGTVATAALACGIVAAPKVALAQTIKYEVKVKGYTSSGWIEVRDGGKAGGAVIRDKSGTWTDRVSRSEELRVSISDSKVKQCEVKNTIVGVIADNGFVKGSVVKLPYQKTFTVAKDPSFDNVTVVVIGLGSGKVVTRRVPIGTR